MEELSEEEMDINEESPEREVAKVNNDEADRFQVVVAILIAIVSLVGTAIGWQASLVGGGRSDRAGLEATLNAEITRFNSTSELYRHYRAYTAYALNDEFSQQLERDLLLVAESGGDDSQLNTLSIEQSAAQDIVGTSQQFFPPRYLNRDGSYNTQRELGEAWAQASQLMDLDSQPHFDKADEQRTKSLMIIINVVVLTLSLLFFTIAEGLHAGQVQLRKFTAGSGTLFLVISIIAAIGIERIF